MKNLKKFPKIKPEIDIQLTAAQKLFILKINDLIKPKEDFGLLKQSFSGAKKLPPFQRLNRDPYLYVRLIDEFVLSFNSDLLSEKKSRVDFELSRNYKGAIVTKKMILDAYTFLVKQIEPWLSGINELYEEYLDDLFENAIKQISSIEKYGSFEFRPFKHYIEKYLINGSRTECNRMSIASNNISFFRDEVDYNRKYFARAKDKARSSDLKLKSSISRYSNTEFIRITPFGKNRIVASNINTFITKKLLSPILFCDLTSNDLDSAIYLFNYDAQVEGYTRTSIRVNDFKSNKKNLSFFLFMAGKYAKDDFIYLEKTELGESVWPDIMASLIKVIQRSLKEILDGRICLKHVKNYWNSDGWSLKFLSFGIDVIIKRSNGKLNPSNDLCNSP
jgi:hypothetical protein